MASEANATSTTDVLVVGAGPTGLTMACELRRHGAVCRIVDKNAHATDQSRATDMQARTLEILDHMGIVDRAIARGHVASKIAFYSGGRPIGTLALEVLDSPYPCILGISQHATEAMLAERLDELGGAIEREVQLTSFRQDADGVIATLRRADGAEESVRARYLVACDGASSTVRQSLGLSFEGLTYEEHFLLCDAHVAWGFPSDESAIFFSDDGFLVALPMPGDRNMRIFVNAPPEEEPTLATFERLFTKRACVPAKLSNPGWTSRFRLHSRKVDRFRVGRIFLAGDAAHIHSPVGGQGMNLGMQDAYNLAWKLALVLRGRGRESLLESYDPEREPLADLVLGETHRGTRMALLGNPFAKTLRDTFMGLMSRFEPMAKRMLATQAELSWSYVDSPIVGERRRSVLRAGLDADPMSERATVGEHFAFGGAPCAGERAPDAKFGERGDKRLFDVLRGTKHTLLLFDGRASTPHGYARLARIAARVAPYADVVATHAVVPRADVPPELAAWPSVLLDPDAKLHARYGAGAECMYLVRPDGYVGYRSQPADEDGLVEHIENIFA